LGASVKTPISWVRSATCGGFGAAAAAAKILGLGEGKMLNAMGIAYTQTSGNEQSTLDGAMTKPLQLGFAAKAGVVSAILSHHGVVGPKNVLEGRYGYFKLYERGEYDPSQLVTGLGKDFKGIHLSVKPYPSCRLTHPAIDAAQKIFQQFRPDPQQIEKITIILNQQCFDIVGHPFKIRKNPYVDAQFSVAYTVAVALKKGDFGLEDLQEERIRDLSVLELVRKVRVVVDEKLENQRGVAPVIVQVRTKDGKEYSKRIEIPKGHTKNPLDVDAIAQKYRKCVGHSSPIISAEKVEKAIDMICNLERIDRIEELINNLIAV
jgi:2-methylcitrate dehydratase PrpD